MKYPLATLLLSLAPLGTATAGQNIMQPGLWEITTEVEMTGMPMKMPPQTTRHCYTAEELSNSRNAVPRSDDSNCEIMNYRLEGNTASWEIRCHGPSAMQGKAHMTMEATRYTGGMDAKISSPAGDMQMHNRWQARRIGDCR